eukprot:COSAG01_NODE_6806_length_3488_cov_26.281499_2_plen_65_part_00
MVSPFPFCTLCRLCCPEPDIMLPITTAIPISIIFDSFQNVLEEDDSDEEDEQAHIVEGVTAPQE